MIADTFASLRQALRPTRTDFTDAAPMSATQSSPMPMYERLADWLPYSGWLPEERLFLLERPPEARVGSHDPVEAVGFVLAITPQTGADDRMTGVLKSIFNGLPTESSLQFHLFGSPDIHDFLNRYQTLRSTVGLIPTGCMSNLPAAAPSIWPVPLCAQPSPACPGWRATSGPPCP